MQYTIRDIPEDVDKALRARAKAEGKSLNQTTVETITSALGIRQTKRKYRDLSDLVGSLVRDPEFDRVMEEQDQMRAVRLDQLRQDVRKGLESGTSEPWDAQAVRQQARARRAATKASAKA